MRMHKGDLWLWVPFQGSGLGGERLQHFTSVKHEAWVHAPPPQPSIFGSVERFVVEGAAPDIPSDAQPEVPASEDAILLPPPPDRHPTPCGGYTPEGHTQQPLILNWPFFFGCTRLGRRYNPFVEMDGGIGWFSLAPLHRLVVRWPLLCRMCFFEALPCSCSEVAHCNGAGAAHKV